jgi:Tfp pilus assembly protein PilF
MTRYWIIALLALVPQLGCVALPGIASELPTLEPSDDLPPPAATTELPPAKAAQACFATARLLEQNGHPIDAIREYERAREFNPRLRHVSHRLAVLYQRQGDYAKAAVEFQQALERTPKDADLLNDMGYFCYEREEWSEAEKWLRQAVVINPKHQRAWVNLGMTLGQQGKPSEGYAAFIKVVPPAQAYANVGQLLVQQGNIDEGRQALRKALELEPDLKQVRALLNRLEDPAQTMAVTGGAANGTARGANSVLSTQ